MKTLARHLSIAGLFALLFLVGCTKSPVGTYISQKNANHYMELRNDGAFFLNEAGHTLSGKYRVEGHTITIETPMGLASRGTIDGDTLTDKDGDKWVRK